MTQKDVDRAKQMMKYEWFSDKKWQKEIQGILDHGFKMEVDSFLTKSVSFITEEYIPKKLDAAREKFAEYLEHEVGNF